MEKEQIIQTVINIFNGADEHDWTKVQNAFAENVLLDFTSMNGGNAAWQSSKQIIDAWAAFLPGFDKTHHQLSNFEVVQNDNNATVHYHGKADHFIAKEVWTVEGTYDTELLKADNTWKITKHTFHLVQQTGNTSLPAQAIEIVKSKG